MAAWFKLALVTGIVIVALAGQAVAQGGDSAGNTGTTGTKDTSADTGGKSPEIKTAGAPAAAGKTSVSGKASSPVTAPVTGTMGSLYTGGWSGLGGGFIGDFGPQYNTYPCGFGMESWNAFGPLGMFGQYGMYGPFGMYGTAGPSFGSGLGFGGFGAGDPWRLYKGYNIARAAEAKGPAAEKTGQAAAAAPKGGGTGKSQAPAA